MLESQALPEPTPYDNLLRFHMHCSFVKHLEISREGWSLDFSAYDQIPTLVPPGRRLLPNLLSLTFKVPDGEIDAAEKMGWVSELVSSSLRAFHIGHKSGSDPSCISATLQGRDLLLDTLAKRCPDLRSLGLLVIPGYGSYDDGFLHNLPNWNSCSCLPYISSLTAIRDFSTSPLYLQAEGLQVLQRLPALESLKVTFPDTDSYPGILPEALSDYAFPALRSLSFRHVPSPAILARLWNLPWMVAGLTSLDITSSFQGDGIDFMDKGPSRPESRFSGQESQIRSLSLGHTKMGFPGLNRSNLASLLHSVSAFPLRFLKIYGQEHGGFSIDSSSDQLCQVGLPSLQRLELFHIEVDFEGLQVFAQSMPNLEYLRAQISMASISSIRTPELLLQPRSSAFGVLEVDLWDSTINLVNTRLFTYELNSEDGIRISAFLAAVWPNAQIVINPDQRWLTTKQELELRQTRNVIKLLNRQILAFALRSLDTGVPVGELSVSDCIITEEAWGQCLSSVAVTAA